MSTHIAIGYSPEQQAQEAILQACVHVKNQLNSVTTDLIIVFALPEYIIPELSTIITRTLKPKYLIGSSCGSLIIPEGVTTNGITIIGINSTDIHFGIAAVNNLENQDMHYAGFDLARRATQNLGSHKREAFISFAQGIEKNNVSFLRGIKESLGVIFPVLGAISSDDLKHKNIFQLYQDQILHHSAVGLLLGGTLNLELSSGHGFKPLGKPRIITKVDGPIIRTIDDKPAAFLYKHFLG
ncbi:MAG: hypothetical protein HQL13_06785, partial [Candidatus Omnitrophica bacterium]|nr:hypothetical protein [Candidatus Omnitrophota bacterium]